MKLFHIFFITTLFKTNQCSEISMFFMSVNKNELQLKQRSAEVSWKSLLDPNTNKLEDASKLLNDIIIWQNIKCDNMELLQNYTMLNKIQVRKLTFLCTGPKYTYDEAIYFISLHQKLQNIYANAKICLPADGEVKDANVGAVEYAILDYIRNSPYWQMDPKHDIQLLVKENTAKIPKRNFPTICLKGEHEFNRIMAFSRNAEVLEWTWLAWRELVAPPMMEPYNRMVAIENIGAIRNGYTDIGDVWRRELEIPNLKKMIDKLYTKIKPLYTLLHGVVRFFLRKYYGDAVPTREPIPAHLLGDLWSQNWEPLSNLIIDNDLDLNENFKRFNWTVLHMVRRADDFYQSLGLPAMTETFWKHSVFTRLNDRMHCHGTAADMYKHGDVRILYCSGKMKDDFYVLHHEMGHIQYYMAYENMPTLFRDANPALHESIGDAIMLGVMTPLHLHRLGLINDTVLYENGGLISEENEIRLNKNGLKHDKDCTKENKLNRKDFHLFDEEKVQRYLEAIVKDDDDDKIFQSTHDILLLKQALYTIPQIPFSLLIDTYRWKYFDGSLKTMNLNGAFWDLAKELQGIAPPRKRGEEYFDVGAKYHVSDNTPYIRYFLSKILQFQLFESLCKAAVFGRTKGKTTLPPTIPLHSCDIYGSKTAGKLLKDIMSRGHSQNIQTILKETIGQKISTKALEKYFNPLKPLLMKVVRKHNIPLGW